MMKNVFYFVLKALFVLKTFKFCIGPLVIQKKKGLIRKNDFKICDVTPWETGNYNTYIA